MPGSLPAGSLPTRLSLALKALKELGPRQLGLYALYQIGLRSGYYRWTTRSASHAAQDTGVMQTDLIALPNSDEMMTALGVEGRSQVLKEADEIAVGQVRLFGEEAVPLDLNPDGSQSHWTTYQREIGEIRDIKFIWELGRFGWAFTLCRAYLLSADERYPEVFWEYAEEFLQANPPYLGPHWTSAQEVALRLIALVFAWQVVSSSPHSTPERARRLASAVAAHAERIPPTMVYARAQNNNHLLSEAAGLYTAGLALPDHPKADDWRGKGWSWFQRGLQTQIATDGTYTQQSTNYHRLMLQLALWMSHLCATQGNRFPAVSKDRLVAATNWFLALLEPSNGRAPNLGPNDGAYIFPLTNCLFSDYRPVLQAAARSFLGQNAFKPGNWDEMALWLVGSPSYSTEMTGDPSKQSEVGRYPVVRNAHHPTWAYLRAAHFNSRPGHADQLHLDLWWCGLNVAQDAGTYSYNAPPPWDNALAGSDAHNVVIVNQQDQMTRAGRFLFLDWAQARVLSKDETSLVAQHDGYRHLGVIHRRLVRTTPEGNWIVTDSLLPANEASVASNTNRLPSGSVQQTSSPPVHATLHWLLLDWDWELNGEDDNELEVKLFSPLGIVTLVIEVGGSLTNPPKLQVVRAGELLYGSGLHSPTWGWSSPTYGHKIPALSLRVSAKGGLPLSYTTRFLFPTT